MIVGSVEMIPASDASALKGELDALGTLAVEIADDLVASVARAAAAAIQDHPFFGTD